MQEGSSVEQPRSDEAHGTITAKQLANRTSRSNLARGSIRRRSTPADLLSIIARASSSAPKPVEAPRDRSSQSGRAANGLPTERKVTLRSRLYSQSSSVVRGTLANASATSPSGEEFSRTLPRYYQALRSAPQLHRLSKLDVFKATDRSYRPTDVKQTASAAGNLGRRYGGSRAAVPTPSADAPICTVNYAPTVVVNAKSGVSDLREQVLTAIAAHTYELGQMLEREAAKQRRTEF